MSRLPPNRTELDLAVAEGFLAQSELDRLLAGGADAQAELRARLGEQAWARLQAQAAELRAVGEEDQILVDELPGRYRPHQDPRRLEVRELGHGAQGAVQVVWDAQLERDVAMKVLRPGMSVARFVREARVLSRLDHPALPTLYELGRSSAGLLYFTMRYVQGRPISEAARTLDLRSLLEVYLRACEVIAYAHSQGVVHRDLKPEHLVVGDFGKVTVLDWGLARVLALPEIADDRGRSLVGPGVTEAGLALGTPGYRAPEQERGLPAGPTADVYALGKILDELLPERAEAPLRSIARRATTEMPDTRYPSAAALSLEAQRWLRGDRVESHSYTALQRAGRLSRRHGRGLAMLWLAALVALMLAMLDARSQRAIQAPLLLARAWQVLRENGDPGVAQVLAASSLRIKDRPEARGALIAAMSRWRPYLVAIHEGPTSARTCTVTAVHGSGAWACVGDHHEGIDIFRPGRARETWRHPFQPHPPYLSWNPAGDALLGISNGLDGAGRQVAGLVGYGTLAGAEWSVEMSSGAIQGVAWLDQRQFATAFEQRGQIVVGVFAPSRTEPVWTRTLPSNLRGVGGIAAFGDTVYVGTLDGSIAKVHAFSDDAPIEIQSGRDAGTITIALASEQIAATGTSGMDHLGRIMLASRGEQRSTHDPALDYEVQSHNIVETGLTSALSLLYLTGGRLLMALSPVEDRAVFVDTHSGDLLTSMRLPASRQAGTPPIHHLRSAESTGNRLFVISSVPPREYEFTLQPGPWIATTDAYGDGAAMRARFSPDGCELVMSGLGAEAIVLGVSDLRTSLRFSFVSNGFGQGVIVSDDHIYAQATGSGVRQIHRTTGQVAQLAGPENYEAMALSPDQRWLALGVGGEGRIDLVDLATRQITRRMKVFPRSIYTLAWLSDTELFAGSFVDGAQVVNLDPRAPPEERRVVENAQIYAGHGSLSADGRVFAYGNKSTLEVLQTDIATGAQRLPLAGHTDWPIMVDQGTVPGHGELLASASWDGTLRLWTRDHALAVIPLGEGALWDADFSSDGRLVASAGADGAGRVYRLFLDTDEDGDDDLDLLRISGEEALQDAYDRFGLVLDEDGEVVYAPGWRPTAKR